MSGKQITLALGAALLALGAAQAASAGGLEAGAGKADITEDAADFPIAFSHEKRFVDIHDHVYARALALDDHKRRVVLVNLEVTTPPDGTATGQAIAQALNLPASDVLVFASHTHGNPLVFWHGGTPTPDQARAIARTRDGALAAARAAVAALAPAKIAFARGKAFVNINNGEAAGLSGWSWPDGPSDKTLNVVRVEGMDGKPLALLVNYATHGEVMFRSVTKDGGYEETGDLPGATMHLLESTGAAPVVLWAPAAEADQLPLFKSLQPASGGLPAADEGAGGWALLDVQARRLALAVENTLAQMPEAANHATLSAAASHVTCAGQHYLRDAATGQFSLAPSAPPAQIPLGYLRVGNIVFAGIAGDVGSAIGESIRKALPESQSIVLTQMAGSIGYILPDSAFVKPGHGVFGSSVAPGCAEPALVRAFQKLDRATR